MIGGGAASCGKGGADDAAVAQPASKKAKQASGDFIAPRCLAPVAPAMVAGAVRRS
jgi:hypothetical protein